MRRIGIIGGMSWESTAEYYRLINQVVKQKLGGLHSGNVLIYSYDFEEIEVLQRAGQWPEAARSLIKTAKQLQLAGADFIIIASNTMHKIVPDIEREVDLPVLHIADATGQAIASHGFKTVGLLGTRFTMEGSFYKDRLLKNFDISVVVPSASERQIVHDIIYTELCLGIIKQESKAKFLQIIGKLAAQGAQGVILGCTEIPLLVKSEDSVLPVFDTTAIHAAAAVELALLNN